MSYPTITYGQTWMHDCNDTAGWAETESGLPCTLTVENDDYFKLEGTCDNIANEFAYYKFNVTDFSTNDYPRVIVRWKTSAASAGLQARIHFDYTVGNKVEVLGYSQTWTVTEITLDAGKTVTDISLYADDEPDTVAAGTFQVYYDFVLCCQGQFTFPKCDVDLYLPTPRISVLEPPTRDGDILQNLGSKMARIFITAEMTQESTTSWGSPKGQRIYQNIHRQSTELWQWVTLPTHGCKFKACIEEEPVIRYANGRMYLDLRLKEYKLAPTTADENYAERFGH